MSKQTMALNSVDRILLAQEAAICFNSHLVGVIAGEIDAVRLNLAFRQLVTTIPILRSTIDESGFYPKRVIHSHFDESRVQVEVLNDAISEREFENRRFNLASEFPVRLGVRREGENTRIITTLHHSAADGTGQVFFLEGLIRLYNGEGLDASWNAMPSHRFRRSFLTHPHLICYFLFFAAQAFFKKRIQAASLLSSPENTSRQVERKEWVLTPEQLATIKSLARSEGLSFQEWMAWKWSEVLMSEMNRDSIQHPFTLAIPVELRHRLRLRDRFQNLIGMVWVRGEKQSDFVREYRKKIFGSGIFALPFGLGFWTILVSFEKLKRLYRKVDTATDQHFSTAAYSSGRLPKNFPTFASCPWVKISGHGGMLKSPGIALMLVGFDQKCAVTLEYLDQLISSERVGRISNGLEVAWKLRS